MKKTRAPSQFIIVAMALAFILSGTFVEITEAKLPLPRCEKDEDCYVLCTHCYVCVCGGGICIRGCPPPPLSRNIIFEASSVN
ncbi:hypothetical protein ACET3Z_024832 [Daucus carota]